MDWEFASVLFFAVGFMLPGCLCCGTPCGTVSGVCSSTPSVTVTTTGFTNNGCSSCSDYNATWILTRDTDLPHGTGECWFRRIETSKGCRVVPNSDQVAAQFDDSGSDVILTIQVVINGPSGASRNNQLWRANVGTLPVDCKNLGTVSVPFDSTIIALACNHDGSDVEAVMS